MSGKSEYLFLFALILFLTACSRKEEVPQAAPAADLQAIETFYRTVQSARTTAPSERLDEDQFYKEMHIQAYEKFGRKNPIWDKQARAYLASVVDSLASKTNAVTAERKRLATELEQLGCNDPLVRYRILLDHHNDRANIPVTNWVQAAFDIDQADYPVYWKFYSHVQARNMVRAEARRTQTKLPFSPELANASLDRLTRLLQDHSLPTSVPYSAVNVCVLKDLDRVRGLGKWAVDHLEPLLIKGWGDTRDAWYAIARFRYSYAWDERGEDWAKNVTAQGWQAMATHLPIARGALEKSWAIEPSEKAALRMLRIELGYSLGRDEMERWFNRAMWMNPASYDACEAKLRWLLPKWHGSEQELLEFAHQCLTNAHWKGEVPLILQEAHFHLATWHRESGAGTEDEYWRRPGVWNEVKASFERFFELNPNAIGWRHNYALAAYKCRAWRDLRAQLKLLGPVSHGFFGGKEAFEKMVRDAETNGSSPL